MLVLKIERTRCASPGAPGLESVGATDAWVVLPKLTGINP